MDTHMLHNLPFKFAPTQRGWKIFGDTVVAYTWHPREKRNNLFLEGTAGVKTDYRPGGGGGKPISLDRRPSKQTGRQIGEGNIDGHNLIHAEVSAVLAQDRIDVRRLLTDQQ